MREIKFRAWDKEDKRMIVDEQEFIPLKVTSKGILRLNPSHEENFWEFVDSNRFELMEFTGLLDKNGKEMYEEDIVRLKDYHGERIVSISFHSGVYYYGGDGFSDEYMFNSSDREVIGNIYENPELLEVE